MPHRVLSVAGPDAPELAAALAELRQQMGVPADFPSEVLAEADATVQSPQLPTEDRTDIPFVTIDPLGARDLDQAFHFERPGPGYLVRYAIADVSAFVRPGGAVEAEAQRRGQTLYAPDIVTLLHPPSIAHDAGSLLPGQDRPALVWTIELDEHGESVGVDVRRALVRSRAQLDYPSVQRALDDGTADEQLVRLREIGELRQARERERGGITLPIPEQQVSRTGEGWQLAYEAPLPVESWNAQISLMTGMAAAELMLYAEVGILRTLPEPSASAIRQMRRVATGLGVPWPPRMSHDEFVRTLDPAKPPHAALVAAAAGLLRGAGYVAFDGGVPEQAVHAGVASEYAHATAPLRRLVDRYVGEVCVALCADREPPVWLRSALPRIAALMTQSAARASQYESAIVSIFEAVLLSDRVGDLFDAVVIDVDDDGENALVQIRDPAVIARCTGRLRLGGEVRVRLVEADVMARRVGFAPVGT